MNCSKCSEKAVFLKPCFCKNHFINYFENKVSNTIKKFSLIDKNDSIVVACSGGKDSTTVLYLLKKLGFNVEALVVDEGIVGYRDKTIVDLKMFCKKFDVKLRIVSFSKSFGKSLDTMLKQKNHPCTICGTFRRYLLNKCASNYDLIATGHNLDDEAQAVLMNLIKSNTELLLRSSPKSQKVEGFVPRIKPLYFCSEKEVAIYALLKNFGVGFTECPYMDGSFRNVVRTALNDYEQNNSCSKLNLINKHLNFLKTFVLERKNFRSCKFCSEPSKESVCKACQIAKSFK